ncbi:hypothetical protein TRVL_09331 [Trypanosoma vivax]|nr:hypothetical protein TRVL_09331 [Trypanosoma vivax]
MKRAVAPVLWLLACIMVFAEPSWAIAKSFCANPIACRFGPKVVQKILPKCFFYPLKTPANILLEPAAFRGKSRDLTLGKKTGIRQVFLCATAAFLLGIACGANYTKRVGFAADAI